MSRKLNKHVIPDALKQVT